MKLSVLIPMYNEAASIAAVVRRVAAVDVVGEIIVVDDGSTDGSGDRVAALCDVPILRLIRQPVNQGKGAAVRRAIGAAGGDAVIIQDADLEYFPEDFPALMAPLEAGLAPVVYGVRDLASQPLARRLGNRLLTAVTNRLFGGQLADMETCYKLIRTDVARSLDLRSARFEIEPEITVKLLRAGHRIHQVPIRYAPRRRRKLNPWRDGPHALWTLLKLRYRS